MVSSSWKCKKCCRVGGFILRGNGIIVCSGCGAKYMILANGQMLHIGQDNVRHD